MQKMVPIQGKLAPCPKQDCGRQPKHWHDLRRGGTHFLECMCGNKTPSYSTFTEAVTYWEHQIPQLLEEAS